MNEMTREEAIRIRESKEYEKWTDKEKVAVMLYGRRLCMPFDVFHEALEKVLGRPVWTHEMGFNWEGLIKEFEGVQGAPSVDDIINLIPTNKRMIVVTKD